MFNQPRSPLKGVSNLQEPSDSRDARLGITYRLSRTGRWCNTHNARPWQCGVISSSPAPSQLFIKNFSAHSRFCWSPFQIHAFQEWNESVLPLTNSKHHQQLKFTVHIDRALWTTSWNRSNKGICRMQGIQNSTTKLEGKVQIPVSHARSFTTTVAEMKTSIQITSTRPMLSVIVGLFDPQTIIITFSSATPYTFTSQFSSKEARYSNLYSFFSIPAPRPSLRRHPRLSRHLA